MTTRPKKPAIPRERYDTLRHEIVTLLRRGACSVRDISGELRIAEKEVYDHLEHIRTAIHKSGGHFHITPAVCRKCGYVFQKRERLRKPGKCPVCQGEQIDSPLFSLE
jgi:predicted Zn-ribbon and HTH transcriptional regulator